MNQPELIEKCTDVDGSKEVNLWKISDSQYEIERVVSGLNTTKVREADSRSEAVKIYNNIITKNEKTVCNSCGSQDLISQKGGNPELGFEYYKCKKCGNSQEKE